MKNKGLEQYIDRNMVNQLARLVASLMNVEDFGKYLQKLQGSTTLDAIRRYDKSANDKEVKKLAIEYATDYGKWVSETHVHGLGFVKLKSDAYYHGDLREEGN